MGLSDLMLIGTRCRRWGDFKMMPGCASRAECILFPSRWPEIPKLDRRRNDMKMGELVRSQKKQLK